MCGRTPVLSLFLYKIKFEFFTLVIAVLTMHAIWSVDSQIGLNFTMSLAAVY